MEQNITFKKGSWRLNQDPNFNFQLNRVIMWDGGDEEELLRVGHTITDSRSWVKVMTGLAKKAEKEGRMEHAIGYWRMAEFFMYDGEEGKKAT